MQQISIRPISEKLKTPFDFAFLMWMFAGGRTQLLYFKWNIFISLAIAILLTVKLSNRLW